MLSSILNRKPPLLRILRHDPARFLKSSKPWLRGSLGRSPIAFQLASARYDLFPCCLKVCGESPAILGIMGKGILGIFGDRGILKPCWLKLGFFKKLGHLAT